MDLLKPKYDPADWDLLDQMRSRLNVANALLDSRLALGLSQEELAAKAGTRQSRVSEVESMKGNPRFDTLDRITRVLGLMIVLAPRETLVTTIATSGYQVDHSATYVTMTSGSGGAKVLVKVPSVPAVTS